MNEQAASSKTIERSESTDSNLTNQDDSARRGGSRLARVLLATARHSLVRAVRTAVLTVGFSLMVSPDGLHAVMSALRETPEIILLDSSLSGVDVDTVESILRRDARTATIPILRVSGYDG